MTEQPAITTRTAGGVRTIVLNRPERRNAVDLAMLRAYYAALAAAEEDRSVRAVLVTGAGGTFCAGAAPELLDELGGTDGRAALLDGLGHPPHLPLLMRKPVIAAINGSAAGVGLVLALLSDVRFLAENARLSTVFSRLGLIAEYGSAWLLPRLVGTANALDLLLSARSVDAAEARRLGLVQRVVPRDDVVGAAATYAAALAAECAPDSLAVIKKQVLAGWEQSLTEAVDASMQLMVESVSGPAFAEAIQARADRRKPDFAPGVDAVGPGHLPVTQAEYRAKRDET
ncbi:enoyl-CoA hydratase-related protein [Micromonospora sp. NPDC047557]|uniref:enoyl-CoA hydratase-related protein n=1 Tax=Micromonospora sp. NPDC047557 TaxID=3364250 RepID=UPI0037164755